MQHVTGDQHGVVDRLVQDHPPVEVGQHLLHRPPGRGDEVVLGGAPHVPHVGVGGHALLRRLGRAQRPLVVGQGQAAAVGDRGQPRVQEPAGVGGQGQRPVLVVEGGM
ncbi:MAG: hypothetical protein ACJ75A_06415 [Actinomycetes bacterium]